MTTSRIRGKLLVAAVVLAACFFMPLWAGGQAITGQWSPPQSLFETDGRASEAEVVADAAGVVHVFWAYGAPEYEEDNAAEAIYYARLENGNWSTPVDVLVSPGGRVARMHSVIVDPQGFLHVVWSGGNAIFHSRAYAPEAGSARAWSEPTALVSGVSALEPGLAVDNDGRLYAVWTQASAGLMFAQSDDGGRRWSIPQVIFPAGASNELARWGRIAVDERGRLHAALEYAVRDVIEGDERDDPNYLYYLRSEDRGETWSTPQLMTPDPDFGEMNVATFGEDVVHLVWNGRSDRRGRYHRWSEDGGQTWSNLQEVAGPAEPAGDGGLTGFPTLAVDSMGTVHMVSAAGGGDYYFRWQDGAWSAPLLISPGLTGDGVTGENTSLEQPSIAINQDSELHVVFHDGFERIWHVAGETGLPMEPAVSFQAAEPLPTPGSTVAAPAGVVAAAPGLVPTDAEQGGGLSNLTVIALSALPVLLLLFLVSLVRRPKR